MMISTKGRYALRVMLDMALQEERAFIPLKAVAQRQNLSVKYIEAIVATLHRGGMLESQRGKTGGYRLVKKPEEYTAAEILTLTEGTLAPVSCLDDCPACEHIDYCMTQPLWKKLDEVIDNFLSQISLKDLLDGKLSV